MPKYFLIGLTALGASSLVYAITPERPPQPEFSAEALAAVDPTRIGRLVCSGTQQNLAILESRLGLASDVAARQGLGGGRMGLYDDVPATDLPLGEMDPLARRYFEQGLALSFGFNHAGAIRSFQLAQEIAPDCAMCLWGEAMANGPNINAGMDSDQNRAALAALERAEELATGESDAIRALIAAQRARYSDDPDADRASLDAAYADSMMALARANPASDDLAIIAAEAAMNTTPWDYWAENGEARPRVADAIALIEQVMERSPRHPQASHLYIHLMELPQPQRAEAAADRLRDNAPASLGHLVHMPSHIYFRLGRYADSAEANIAAVAADEAYLAEVGDDGLVRYGYYPHNVHFLLTSAQMMGDVRTIFSQSAHLRTILDEDISRDLYWVQAIHAAPSFALAQYGSPEAILALTANAENLAYVDAMRRYARAVAYGLQKDGAGFAEEIAALDALVEHADIVAMQDGGFPAPAIVALAAHVARGKNAQAQGDFNSAITHFEAAIELERQIPYTEPAYWYFPVAQSLGAAKYQAGDYAGARRAFGQALMAAPNNAMALYGLMQTERRLGNRLEAESTRQALDRVWQGDDDWLSMDRI